ncbi:hypothetical protein [Kitasatospora sp. NPDC056181]|uniref:hypothetical protein n=1 Tax=Kitasatospora sp. NPDC056181 TaxID=3345737 RepID=UPI0035D59859
MSIEDGDLTVAVDGHLEPTTEPIGKAITTLWQMLRGLAISDYERRAMHQLLGAGDTRPIERRLDGEGAVDWPLSLASGGTVTVRVWRGDGLTSSQRVAARYVPVQLPATDRCPGLWAIRDATTGDLVREDDERGRSTVVRFGTESSARDWVTRQITLAGYRATRGLAAGGRL